ncbi:hypothetical protein HMPREF9946_03123 [Acetobacteraceae bacterium AT-5844]|nr:hypothetical protein HMPREF9946_03123 [Acetobacteraceae bacterium AT-5844]
MSAHSFNPKNYDTPADFEADRILRHKAARKLHQAEWAKEDDDIDDAILEIRRASALVMKMHFPVAAAVALMAEGIDAIHGYSYDSEALRAANALIAPGEEFRDARSPF